MTANAVSPVSFVATSGRKPAPTPQARVLERYLEPLRSFLDDECLTEVVVNRPGEVLTEGPAGWTRHETTALTYGHLINLGLAAAAVTHQDLGPEQPIVSTNAHPWRAVLDRRPARCSGRHDEHHDPKSQPGRDDPR